VRPCAFPWVATSVRPSERGTRTTRSQWKVDSFILRPASEGNLTSEADRQRTRVQIGMRAVPAASGKQILDTGGGAVLILVPWSHLFSAGFCLRRWSSRNTLYIACGKAGTPFQLRSTICCAFIRSTRLDSDPRNRRPPHTKSAGSATSGRSAAETLDALGPRQTLCTLSDLKSEIQRHF